MSREPVIELAGLRKSYAGQAAVRGIDLTINRGEIFAFLGPNGAGKTTTVEILEGFREASGGVVSVLGANPWSARPGWRERIGCVLQESQPEPDLSVRECLMLYAGYYRRPRSVAETLALVDLVQHAETRATKLSGGQRRRLDVALALIGDGELIFLDEPTTGFDPAARRAAWNVIAGLRDLGKTVFLTTHHMEEAEGLADRIAVIADGRIVAEGTPETLGDRNRQESLFRFALPPRLSVNDLPKELVVTGRAGGQVTITSPNPTRDLNILTTWALARSVELSDLQVARPSLEDVYLRLIRANDEPTVPARGNGD